MVREADGKFRTRIALFPGIYRYLFIVDGRWVLDPKAMAVDRSEGHENGVVIVSGSVPPLFFAPDRRHVVRPKDGSLRVHAEVAAGSHVPRRIFVHSSETSAGEVFVVGQSVGRVMLKGEILLSRTGEGASDARDAMAADVGSMAIASTERNSMGRRTPDPGGSRAFDGTGVLWFEGFEDQRFCLPAESPSLARSPSWAKDAVFYLIFVDRWLRSPSSPRDPRAVARTTPSTSSVFYGGDLEGIRERLDDVVMLGVNTLLLTPIQHAASPHRYDVLDHGRVDDRLGGDRALRRLVASAHDRGLRLVVDVSLTHVHVEHFAFADLLLHQEDSSYRDWFMARRFPIVALDGRTYDHYPGDPAQPWLNLRCAEARRHVLESVVDLLRAGVDGFRLDAMHEADDEFWQDLRERVHRVDPEILLLGEVVSDDLAYYGEERGLDMATDFSFRESVKAFFVDKTIDAVELWRSTVRREHRIGPFPPWFRLVFLDNHDTPRFLSLARDRVTVSLALVYLLTRPEAVSITYGTEANLAGGADEGDEWSDRLPMVESGALKTEEAHLIRELLRLRRSLAALRSPAIELVFARGGQLAHLRRAIGEGPRVAVVINISDETMRLPGPLQIGFSIAMSVNEEAAEPSAELAARSARILVETSERAASP